MLVKKSYYSYRKNWKFFKSIFWMSAEKSSKYYLHFFVTVKISMGRPGIIIHIGHSLFNWLYKIRNSSDLKKSDPNIIANL